MLFLVTSAIISANRDCIRPCTPCRELEKWLLNLLPFHCFENHKLRYLKQKKACSWYRLDFQRSNILIVNRAEVALIFQNTAKKAGIVGGVSELFFRAVGKNKYAEKIN